MLGEHEKLGIVVRASQHSLLLDGELNEALHVRHVTYGSNATEPLHDFKGHMANVIGEVRVITNGSTKRR